MLIMPTRCANVDQRFPFQQSHPNELLLDLNLFLVGMPVELVAVRLDGEDGRGHALGSQGVSEVLAEASPSGTAEFPKKLSIASESGPNPDRSLQPTSPSSILATVDVKSRLSIAVAPVRYQFFFRDRPESMLVQVGGRSNSD